MNSIDMSLADRVALPHSLMGIILSAFVLFGLSVQPALAQDSISQQDKAMHYSLYYESFKNNEFEAAKGDLEWIIENAPGFPKGDDRNFRRQYELYVGLADKTEQKEKQVAYLDTAATILTTAPKKMDSLDLTYDQFEWEIRKGRFLQEYQEMHMAQECVTQGGKSFAEQALKEALGEKRAEDIMMRIEAATEVSGDFYDVGELPDGRLLLSLGDVAGHGVQAALVVAGVAFSVAMVVLYRRRNRRLNELREDIQTGKRRVAQYKRDFQEQKRHYFPINQLVTELREDYRDLRSTFEQA